MNTIETVLDTYEALCDHARAAREELDGWRWVIGDDAGEVETRYASRGLEEFSKDIGMNKSTVDSYRRVSKFYPKFSRKAVFEAFPNLTYAYYKDAARNEDLNTALLWLEEVSANGWSADEASHNLTERLGRATRESAVMGVYQGRVEFSNDLMAIYIEPGEWPIGWQAGDSVSIRRVGK